MEAASKLSLLRAIKEGDSSRFGYAFAAAHQSTCIVSCSLLPRSRQSWERSIQSSVCLPHTLHALLLSECGLPPSSSMCCSPWCSACCRRWMSSSRQDGISPVWRYSAYASAKVSKPERSSLSQRNALCNINLWRQYCSYFGPLGSGRAMRSHNHNHTLASSLWLRAPCFSN